MGGLAMIQKLNDHIVWGLIRVWAIFFPTLRARTVALWANTLANARSA